MSSPATAKPEVKSNQIANRRAASSKRRTQRLYIFEIARAELDEVGVLHLYAPQDSGRQQRFQLKGGGSACDAVVTATVLEWDCSLREAQEACEATPGWEKVQAFDRRE